MLLLLIATETWRRSSGVRGGPASRLLGLLGAATAMAVVAYLVTPTAGGRRSGLPHYLLPAGLLGLALLLLVLPAGGRQHLYAGTLGAFAIVNVAAGWRLRWFHPSSPRPAVACVTGAAALVLGVLLLASKQLVGDGLPRAGGRAGAAALNDLPRSHLVDVLAGDTPTGRRASLNRSGGRPRNGFRRLVLARRGDRAGGAGVPNMVRLPLCCLSSPSSSPSPYPWSATT